MLLRLTGRLTGRMTARLMGGLLLALTVWAGTALAEGLMQEPVRIPAKFANGELVLDGLVVRPDGKGPFPVVILNHGSPRDPKERATMTTVSRVPQAREFARRGWAVLIVMRRGYGLSQGEYAESNGGCDNTNYVRSGEQSAEDIRQAIGFMARQPYSDPRRVISVGQSAGGFASVALGANPPPGLVAVINFAGGRGSRGDNDVCQPDRLVDAYGVFGRTARVPMLWVYAENDLFFGPALARRFHDAFTRGGGKAELVLAPPYGKEGHFLFSAEGIPLWTPLVDSFLASRGLTLRNSLIALPGADLKPPRALSERNRESFQKYLTAAPNKAFAIASDGAFGWRSGTASEQAAVDGALETCAKHTKTSCRLAFVNEAPAE